MFIHEMLQNFAVVSWLKAHEKLHENSSTVKQDKHLTTSYNKQAQFSFSKNVRRQRDVRQVVNAAPMGKCL